MDKIIRCITSDGAVMASAIDASDIVFKAQKNSRTFKKRYCGTRQTFVCDFYDGRNAQAERRIN